MTRQIMLPRTASRLVPSMTEMTAASRPPANCHDGIEDQSLKDDSIYRIHTKLLFDPLSLEFLPQVTLSVSRKTGLIVAAEKRGSQAFKLQSDDLDLRDYPVVIPGMTDLHTHVFLHTYASAPSTVQELSESPVERIVRATNHLRAALKAGFTTYRDLGTEGLFTADIDLRNAVNRGIIPGPRLFVAGEAIASSGGYAVRTENDASASLGSPYSGQPLSMATTINGRISDQADGIDGVRAAVRRRLAAGADVVKVYVDYRARALRNPGVINGKTNQAHHKDIRFPPSEAARNPLTLLWSQEELDTIVKTAQSSGATVAAHAVSARGVMMAVNAGVQTVEHGAEDEADESKYHPFWNPLENDASLYAMASRGTLWNPTLYILETETDGELFSKICDRVRRAWKIGVKIGVGGDTGPVPHGGNVREIELLVNRCGIPLEEVLRAATVGGWEGCFGRAVVGRSLRSPIIPTKKARDSKQGDLSYTLGKMDEEAQPTRYDGFGMRKFGALRKGWVADLVALGTDIRDDISALRRVEVVVKDGEVVVRDGHIVVGE